MAIKQITDVEKIVVGNKFRAISGCGGEGIVYKCLNVGLVNGQIQYNIEITASTRVSKRFFPKQKLADFVKKYTVIRCK